jgi:hypothetical protein
MDQPFGEIAEKLNGLRPVKSGVIVSDDDTPRSLGLDGEGFIFLVGRLKRTEPASGRREVDSREGTKALAAQLGSRIAAAASARASGGATAPVVVPATASPSLSAPTGTRAIQSDDSVLRVRFRLPPVDRVVAYDWGRAERVASFKVRVLAVRPPRFGVHTFFVLLTACLCFLERPWSAPWSHCVAALRKKATGRRPASSVWFGARACHHSAVAPHGVN